MPLGMRKLPKVFVPEAGPVGRMTRAIRRGNVMPIAIIEKRKPLYMNSYARQIAALREALSE